MADDGEDEPTVSLGAQQAVEGAPLARVSARLMWGIEKSAIVEREGETVIRTPEGPRELADLLDAVDQSYFATRREFEDAIDDVVGDGPIPVESDGEAADVDEDDDGEVTDADDEPNGDETATEDAEPSDDPEESDGEPDDTETEADGDADETDVEDDEAETGDDAEPGDGEQTATDDADED